MSEPDNKTPIYFSFAASLDGSLKESPNGSREAVDIENHQNSGVANLPPMNQNNPAEQLRTIRKSKGWSLQDVEHYSNGKWKAVVVGSYERSDRAISLKKAIALMEFYQVPITELFPAASPRITQRSISLNLVKVKASSTPQSNAIHRFASLFSNRRKDWNGSILTIRENDLAFLALMLNLSESAALDYLTESELLTV
jgi:transcriptional regulator with XRE-family HTH domain